MTKVLVVSRGDIHALISAIPAQYDPLTDGVSVFQKIPADFFSLKTQLVDRNVAEVDSSILQLIPYIVVVNSEDNTIFGYYRGKKGGENRLHAKYSIGLGGHIESEPTPFSGLAETLALEALRELNEEIGLDPSGDQAAKLLSDLISNSYVVYSDSDEVGSVHLGVVVKIAITANQVAGLEKDVIEYAQFWQTSDLYNAAENGEIHFENWSRITFKNYLVDKEQLPVVETVQPVAAPIVLPVVENAQPVPGVIVSPAIEIPTIDELEASILAKMDVIPVEPSVNVTDNAAEVVDVVTPLIQSIHDVDVDVVKHPDVIMNEVIMPPSTLNPNEFVNPSPEPIVEVIANAVIPTEIPTTAAPVVSDTNVVETPLVEASTGTDIQLSTDIVATETAVEEVVAVATEPVVEVVVEAPAVEVAVAEAPVEEVPAIEAIEEAPVAAVEEITIEAPAIEEAQVVTEVAETPVVEEAAVVEVVEAPVVAEVAETPVVEEATVEAPAIEEAAVVEVTEAPVVAEVTEEVAVVVEPVAAVQEPAVVEAVETVEAPVETPVVDDFGIEPIDASVETSVAADVEVSSVTEAPVEEVVVVEPVSDNSLPTTLAEMIQSETPVIEPIIETVEEASVVVAETPVEVPVVEEPIAVEVPVTETVVQETMPEVVETPVTTDVETPVIESIETPVDTVEVTTENTTTEVEVVAAEVEVVETAPVEDIVEAAVVEAPVMEPVTEVQEVVEAVVETPVDNLPTDVIEPVAIVEDVVVEAPVVTETVVVEETAPVVEAVAEAPVEEVSVIEAVEEAPVAVVETTVDEAAVAVTETPIVEEQAVVEVAETPVAEEADVAVVQVEEAVAAEPVVEPSEADAVVETPVETPVVTDTAVEAPAETPVANVADTGAVVVEVVEPITQIDDAQLNAVVETQTVEVMAEPVVETTDALIEDVPVVVTETPVEVTEVSTDSVSVGTVQEISNDTEPQDNLTNDENVVYDIAANGDIVATEEPSSN